MEAHGERMSWTERKTNEDVLGTVKDKRTFVDASRWETVGHALRHPEELHNVICIVGMTGGKRTAERPRNSYTGRIESDARVKTFKELDQNGKSEL